MSVFDAIINNIKLNDYHNQRRETHSDLMSNWIVSDLSASCAAFSADLSSGAIKVWHKTRGPDDRTTDLLAGVPNSDGSPNLNEIRLLIEHKSVITAHRNRSARYQDIDRERLSAHRADPRIIVVATLLVGTCQRVLNIPDCVDRFNKATFPTAIKPRLSRGDARLWDEFPQCVSSNTADDPVNTINLFRELPVRRPADTHVDALDYLLIAPVEIDNVNPPRLVPGYMDIDPIGDYNRMIQHICRLYTLRWHDFV